MVVHEIPVGSTSIGAPTPRREDKWRREQRAFFSLLGSLLNSHRGQYVAIHDGKVVANGPDLIDVTLRAYAAYGHQPIYVDLVEEHPLAPTRFPHYRLIGG